MQDFTIGIIISILSGIGMSAGGILVRVGAKKFRGNLMPKYKQNIRLGLQITLLNTFFISGALMSLFATIGKLTVPFEWGTVVPVTLIYSTSYVSTILFGDWLLKEKVSRIELLAVFLLILAITLVCIGIFVFPAGG